MTVGSSPGFGVSEGSGRSRMKRRLLVVAGMSAMLLGTTVPAPGLARSPERFGAVTTGRKADPSVMKEARKRNQFVMVAVELEGRPVAVYQAAALASGSELSGARKADLRAVLGRRQAALKGRIEVIGNVQATYTDVFNGFRVRVRANRVDDLARLPGVKAIRAVPRHQRHNANTVTSLGAPRTWAQTDLTGKGVSIAVIDTGINYYHADFDGAGYDAWRADNGLTRGDDFPTAKVIDGYDLAGDDYNADDDFPIRQPDGDPLDCKAANAETVQHGTHVAGTAAGTGVTAAGKTWKGPYTPAALASADLRIAPGVAPEAKLMAFRVFGCAGSTYLTTDAIEMAVRAGADVINMSLGSDFGNPGSLDAIATDNASLAGTTVVVSSGNAGPSAYLTGSPAAALRAIAVGAVDAQQSFPAATIDMATGGDIDAINANDGPLPVTGRIVYFQDDPSTPGDPDTGAGYEQSGCMADSYAYNDFPSGRIAVVQRGFCARVDKAKTGDKKGAKAVIQVNNANALPPYENAIAGVDIPFIGVGRAVDGRFEDDDGATVTISASGAISNGSHQAAADFTSAGPGRVRNLIKPDVMAPGVSVFSADGSTVAQGKSLSGTSMAAPAVAGVAALVQQAHPGWLPRSIKAAIIGTAASGRVKPFDLRLAGAGLAQPRKAVDTKAFVFTEPGSSSITFGYQPAANQPGTSTSFSLRRGMQIRNTGNRAITYDLTNVFKTSSYGLSVSIQPRTVTVPAGGERYVTVVITLSRANAGTLPATAPFHAAAIAEDAFGQLYQDITTIGGLIRATPRSSAAGVYPLSVPWHVVPRAESTIQDLPGSRTPWVTDGTLRKSSLKVRNFGLHKGIADVYAWGLQDTEENLGRIDLRAAGVQSVDSTVCDSQAGPNDRCLVFAINLWGTFNNAAEALYEVGIDLDEDGSQDVYVTAIDLGLIFGTYSGITGSLVSDASTGEIINAYFAGVGTNGSTILLPVLASDLGLRPNGDRAFRYFGESFTFYDDDGSGIAFDVMTTGLAGGSAWAHFNAFDPVLNTGAFKTIKSGGTKTIALVVDTDGYQPKSRGQKGWLIVSLLEFIGLFLAALVRVGGYVA